MTSQPSQPLRETGRRDPTPMSPDDATLRESEERYRTLVETAPDIIMTLTPDGRVGSLNPAFESVLGWSRSEWLGRQFATLLHPDERVRGQQLCVRVLGAGAPSTVELRLRTAAGGYVDQEVAASAERRDGQIVGILVIARDVTARKRAEMHMQMLVDIAKDLSGAAALDQMLSRVEARLATAVPCDVVATFCGDDDRGDSRMVSQHGLPPDLAAAARELVFPLGEPFAGAVSRGATICIDDTQVDGPPYLMLFRRFGVRSAVVTPLRSHERDFGSFVIAARGAHAFDQAQVAVCEAVARLLAGAVEAAELQRAQRDDAQVSAALVRVGRELISSVDLPILLDRLCRITTDVIGCDVAYTLMVSEDPDTLLPVACSGESTERWEALRNLTIPLAGFGLARRQHGPPGALLYDAAEHADLIPPPLRAAFALSRSMTVRLQRGERIIGVHVAGYHGGTGTFSRQQQRIALGIAQLASLALENARLVQQLAGANRLKSDFLATMSHELRTPLNVIIGYNELLLDEVFGTLSPEQAASLDRVGTSARELLELISATLDISRLETGRAALNLQDIDLVELLTEIEVETRALREKPGVDTLWQVAPDLPRLQSDAVKLKVLLKNLIANAVKFTDHGSVTISVAARDDWLECTIADTGIGMSAETRAVIFEPFRQGDSSSTRRHGGVGLGLYIVSRLLALLQGRIEVESELGAGSTFRVWIPLDALSPAPLKRPSGPSR